MLSQQEYMEWPKTTHVWILRVLLLIGLAGQPVPHQQATENSLLPSMPPLLGLLFDLSDYFND